MPTRNGEPLRVGAYRDFLILLQERSLTRAAQLLDVSQPALSKSLAKLRSHFGDPLFIRVGSRMEPTARALELERPMRSLIEAERALNVSPRRFSPLDSSRTFSFFLSDIGVVLLLPSVLRFLEKEAPRVRLRVMQADARQLTARLESGEVDLAVGDFPPLVQNIRRQRLYTDDYLGLARQDHPRIGGEPSRSEFLSERHVLVSASGTGHAHLLAERALLKAIPPSNVILRVASFSAAALVVQQSDLVATLPARTARLLARELKLRIVVPPMELPRIHIAQYWHERFHGESGNKWLRSVFVRLFSDKSAKA